MTENERDKEIREEIRRAKREAPKKKRVGLRRALPFLIALAVVLGVVGYAARNPDSADNVRRMLTYNKAKSGADGRTELFSFDGDRTARYELLGKNLLTVSTTRLSLVGESGEEIYSRTVNFSDPAIAVGAQTAAVYDVGGTELYVIGSRGLLRDMSGESGNGILSVSLNASDYMALTVLKSGCRACVTAFDASGEPVFTFRSSEHYISDACVLGDNRHLAAVTLGEADGVFASKVSFYSFDSEKVLNTTTLAGSMVLRLENFDGKLAVFEDDRLTVFDAEGTLAGSCRYSYPYLRGRSVGGNGFLALLLSRYRSGTASRIVTVNAEGEVLGTLDERREILDISAAGRYIAVLYADSLTIYTPELEECAALSETGYAKHVIMCADGSALLLGTTRAWRYVP